MLKRAFLVLGFFWSFGMFAQSIIEDEKIAKDIKKGLHAMYNFEFEEASESFNVVKTKYPNHPAYPLLKAIQLTWEVPAIIPGSDEYKMLESLLKKTLQQSELIEKKDPKNVDVIFFPMNAHSMLGLRYAMAKDYFSAVNEARKTYSNLKTSFKLKDKYKEFYFYSGLYYYYAVQYPITRPASKPFMAFFEPGNKTKGLNELIYASEYSTFYKTEAHFYLANIYIKYENEVDKALKHARWLMRNYPCNPVFMMKYIEIVLNTKDYIHSKWLINELLSHANPFYKATGQMFLGIYERKLNNNNAAKQHFNKALNMVETMKKSTDDIKSYSYYYLAQIAKVEGNPKLAREYLKKCLDHAGHTFMIEECEKELKETRK